MVKIATLNVKRIPSFAGGNSEENLMSILNDFLSGDNDVLMIQESFNKKDRQIIDTFCNNNNLWNYSDRTIGTWGGLATNSGLKIISKYFIIKGNLIAYKDRINDEWFSRKGCLMARIDFGTENGGIVDLFTTHLQAGGGSKISKWLNWFYGKQNLKADEVKARQLEQCVHFIMQNKSNYPIFIGGDFNLDIDKMNRVTNFKKDLKKRGYNLIDTFDKIKSIPYIYTTESNQSRIDIIFHIAKDNSDDIEYDKNKKYGYSVIDRSVIEKKHLTDH